MIRVLGAEPYEKVRELCHKKDMDAMELVEVIGDRFHPYLPEKSVLVPVPGHEGYATHSVRMCAAILVATAKANQADSAVKKYTTLCDCLSCVPHPSLCVMKHRGEDISRVEVEVQWKNELEKELFNSYVRDGLVPILVDNVVDTGKTVRSCMRRLGVGPVQVIAIGSTGRQDPD